MKEKALENNDFWRLAGKMISKDINEAEQSAFRSMLDGDDELKLLWSEIQEDQNSLLNYLSNDTIDVDNAWSKQRNLISKSQKRSKNILAIAASLVIALGIAYLFSYNNQAVIASGNYLRKVTLPDGSMITLNHDSQIKYLAKLNGKNREVYLEGEAFFEVKKNPNHPFLVKTKNSLVKVLGTSFNVKTNQKTEVFVEEGKVLFTSLDQKSSLELVAGEHASFENHMAKWLVKRNDIMDWKSMHLSFQNANLKELKTKLEQHYHVQINYADELKGCLHTGVYHDSSLENIITALEAIYDLEIVKQGELMTITFKACK